MVSDGIGRFQFETSVRMKISVLHVAEGDASKSTAIFLETHFIILFNYEIWRSGDLHRDKFLL